MVNLVHCRRSSHVNVRFFVQMVAVLLYGLRFLTVITSYRAFGVLRWAPAFRHSSFCLYIYLSFWNDFHGRSGDARSCTKAEHLKGPALFREDSTPK